MKTVGDLLREKNGYQRFDNRIRKKNMSAVKEFALSAVRHGLSGAGVALVTLGIVDQSVVDQAASANAEIIVGTVLFFGGPLLSSFGSEIFSKLLGKKK